MDLMQFKIPIIELKDIRYNTIATLSNNVPGKYNPYDIVLDINRNESDVFSFSIPARNEKVKFLYNENIVKFEGENYIIKNFALDDETKTVYKVKAEHESTILKDKQCGKIEIIAGTVEELITVALKDTGWVFGGTDIPLDDKRHLFSEFESSFANLSSIAEVYNAFLKFETKVIAGKEIKSVSLYSKTVDIGRYVRKGKGLKSVSFDYDTTGMVTRLTVFGGMNKATDQPYNMMEAHPQKLSYVEDYSYFTSQGLTLDEIKSNPRFCKEHTMNVSELTSSKMVYDYALNELKNLCIPKCSANLSILDFSMKEDTPWDKPQLNEVIHVFDEDINLELEATITGISKNYSNPLETSISISNVIEKNSVLKELISSGKVIDRIVGTDGKIWGTYIANATIGSAQIGAAVIDTFHLKNGIIDTVHIKDLSVDSAKIKDAAITSAKIADASIGNQHVNNLSADKLNAGKIDTAKVQIVGTDNVIEIIDGQILVNDTKDLLNPINRVIVGKYRKDGGEIKYGILIRGIDGQTIMWDENGATNAGITDGAVDNNKIAVDANIDGSKLNIQTVIHSINNDNGAEKLNGLVIEIDGKSLSVKLTEINELTDKLSENISNNASAIEQNAKEIALKVSQQDYLKDKYEITSDIESTNNNLDVIRSSANMLTGTKTFGCGKWDNCDYSEMKEGFAVVKVKGMDVKAPSTPMSKQHTMFAKDEIFTLSVYAKGKVEGLKLGISTTKDTPYFEPKVVNTEWNKYIWTFKGGDHIGFIIGQSRIDFDRIGTSIMPKFTFQSENANDTDYIEIYMPMVNPGTEAKEWTYSFNDLNKRIDDSVDMLDSITIDNIFSKLEKYEIRREIDIIKSEKIHIEIQANQRTDLNTLKQRYLTAYTELITYISPLIAPSVMNTDSPINGAIFKSTFMSYYDAKVALITEINKVLKARVVETKNEDKISKDDLFKSGLKDLEYNEIINRVTKDNILIPKEKIEIRNMFEYLTSDKINVINRANKYSIAVINLNSRYGELQTYLYNPTNGILKDMNINSSIDANIFKSSFLKYFEAKKTVLESVNEQTTKNLTIAETEATRYMEAQSSITHESFGKVSSEIKTMKDQISLKVEQTDIDKTIINTQIGGSNLLTGSQTFVMQNPTSNINTSKDMIFITNALDWSSWVNLNSSIPRLQDFLNSKNKTYSFGINIKTSKLTSNAKLKFYITGEDTSNIICESETPIPYTNSDWKRVGLKIKFPDEITILPKNVFVKMYGTNDMGLEIAYNKPKLENGEKFTDWDLSPEDVDDAINNVIVTTEDSINTAKSEIKLTTDAISNRVTNNENYTKTVEDSLNQTKETVTVLNNKTAQLEIDRDSIRGEVNNVKQESTETKKKVTDIEGGIGTENYILNAGDFINTDNYTGGATHNENYLQCTGVIKNTTKIPLKSNQFYVYSVTVLPTRNLTSMNFLSFDIYNVSNNTIVSNSLAISITEPLILGCMANEKNRIAIKIKTKANIDGLYYLNVKTQDIASYQLYNLQFEDGSLMSSFRLNSKERDTKILTTTDTKITEMKSVIDQTMDGISSKVQKTEQSLTEVNGTITNHEGRIAVAEEKITPEAIISTVKSGDGKVLPVRYIRVTCAGQKLPIENRKLNIFTEIQAFNGDSTNVALGKTVTSNAPLKPVDLSKIVDGNLRDFISVTTATNSEEVWMQVDLGKIYEDIEYVKVFHKNNEFEISEYYGTKVEISTDGTKFLKLFDSNLAGTYKESSKGHTVKVNDTLDGLAKQTEIKQLDDKIINKVDANGAISAVTQDFGKIVTEFTNQPEGKIIVQNGNFEVHDTQGNPLLRTDGGRIITSGADIYGNNDGTMSVYGNGNKGIEIRSHNDGLVYLDLSKNASVDYHARLLLTRNDLNLMLQAIAPQFRFTGLDEFETRVLVNGSWAVSGAKNCVVDTPQYGKLLINAYETASCYFGDIGRGVISEDGYLYIWVDDKFYETVDSKVNYEVFLQKYSEGDVFPCELTPNYFVVKGTPNTQFAWEVKLKRKDYTNKRLLNFDEEGLLIHRPKVKLDLDNHMEEVNMSLFI